MIRKVQKSFLDMKFFFHRKWPKHLEKIHKKNPKSKNFFLSGNDFLTFQITLRQKIFFLNFDFFCEFFLSVLVILYGKKISCLKMIFGPCWSFLDMNFFWPEKKRFDTFRWISPYSMIFLWSQSSGFASSVRNLVRNWYFTQTDPLRLAAL